VCSGPGPGPGPQREVGKESFRELHQNHLESILSVSLSYETAICLTGSATYLLHFTTLEIYNFMGKAFTHFMYLTLLHVRYILTTLPNSAVADTNV
jgi:hypothetical protein